MTRPNPANPQCPECGKQTRHKRTNQDSREIYSCSCGWSNSVKRIARSPLKRKELNAIAIYLAVKYLQQSIRRDMDLSAAIGGEKWVYSCDELVAIFKRIIEDKNNG